MRARCGREGIGLETQYVVINPNASNLRIERRWCSVNFASLTGRLLERFDGLNAVFTGSGSERRYVSDVVKGISPQYGSRVVNMAGLLPIGELIALLSGARLFITNDSGPLHLAASLGKKTIALFGPCSPGQYGNMPGTISIYKNVYCSPCVHEFDIPPCKGDNACMKAIGVDDVFETAVCVLDEIPIDPGVPGIAYNHCVSERPLGIVVRDR